MEVHQLRYLAAVVDAGSFTAAAHRLHVSQSGVSTQIGKLERELGHRLLERSRGQARPTGVGTAVLVLARQALGAVDAITDTAAEFATAARGEVRLGVLNGCAIPGFLDAIATCGRTHPGIRVSMSEDVSPNLQTKVRARELDLALVSTPTEQPLQGLDVATVSSEQLVAVVPPGHPLDRPEVSLADLVGEPVMCLPPRTGIRTAYDRSCVQAGLPARVDLDAGSPATLAGLAARGAGIAILTTSSGAGPGVVCVPISDAATRADLAVVTRPGERSPATLLLRDGLLDSLSAPVPP